MGSKDHGGALLFADSVCRHAAETPDAPALRMPDGTRTYAEMVAAARAIAGRLQSEGVGAGDRVAFICGACCTAMEAALAATMVRATPVPLSTSVTSETLGALLADCTPKLAFLSSAFLKHFEGAKYDDLKVVQLETDHGERHLGLRTWLSQESGVYKEVEGQPNDLLTLIYSSGTTGIPKGIGHTNGKRSEFWMEHGKVGGGGMRPGSRFLLTTAFYTTGTFVSLLSTLYNGGEAGALARFDVEDFIRRVGDGEVSGTFLIPMQIRRVMDSPSYSLERMQGLTYTLMAGAICDPPTKLRIMENWPGMVVDMYGTSETATLASSDVKSSPQHLNSVGIITPGSRVAIIDDDGKVLPHGETGEIAGWTPSMMDGYFNRPDLTEALYWNSPDGLTYLRTGDVGRLEPDNRLYVTDRKKDMIVSGGANIYSSDIEAVLLGCEDVKEVAVIAIPDDRWGETPYAIVVPHDNAQLDEKELLVWANARLGKMHRLSGLEFRPSLLKNAMGKVLKRDLRLPFWANRTVKVA